MGTPWGCVFFRKRPEEVATAMVPLLLSRIYPGWMIQSFTRPYTCHAIQDVFLIIITSKTQRNKREIPCKKDAVKVNKGIYIGSDSVWLTIQQWERFINETASPGWSGCPNVGCQDAQKIPPQMNHIVRVWSMKDVGVSNQSHPETRGYTEHVHSILGVLTILNKCILIGSPMFKTLWTANPIRRIFKGVHHEIIGIPLIKLQHLYKFHEIGWCPCKWASPTSSPWRW